MSNFEVKNISFDGKKATHKELKHLLAGQGIKMQDFFNDCMENYLIKHKPDMNPLFPVRDSLITDSNVMVIPPALFRRGEIDRTEWANFITSHEGDPILKQLEFDNQTIGTLLRKARLYGSPNTVVMGNQS